MKLKRDSVQFVPIVKNLASQRLALMPGHVSGTQSHITSSEWWFQIGLVPSCLARDIATEKDNSRFDSRVPARVMSILEIMSFQAFFSNELVISYVLQLIFWIPSSSANPELIELSSLRRVQSAVSWWAFPRFMPLDRCWLCDLVYTHKPISLLSIVPFLIQSVIPSSQRDPLHKSTIKFLSESNIRRHATLDRFSALILISRTDLW